MADHKQGGSPGGFSRGIAYPFRAVGFIRRHPRLYRYILIPFLVNLVIFCGSVYLGLGFFGEIVSHYIPQGDTWYWVFLNYFLWTAAILTTMVLVFFLFTAVGCLIASPFNEILSEQTEMLLTGIGHNEPFVLRVFLRDMGRTILEESKKIGLFLLGMAFLLLFHLLPVIGSLLYAFLSTLWTIFFLVVEYTGYVFSRKGMTFSEQRQFVFSHTLLLLGFGTGVICILAIPFFQFLCIPLGVVGATQLYCDCVADLQEMTAVAKNEVDL